MSCVRVRVWQSCDSQVMSGDVVCLTILPEGAPEQLAYCLSASDRKPQNETS